MDWGLIAVLCLGILGVLLVLSRMTLRHDDGKIRGSAPGKGYHTLRSDYQSGLGGHSTEWQVPRDPDEYARSFVPRGRTRPEPPKDHQ